MNKLNEKLGKRVSFSKQLRKGINGSFDWTVTTIEPQQGIICGKRRKRNGVWRCADGGDYKPDYMYFHVYQTIDCYLIATGMNQTVFVPCEFVTFLDEA